MKKQLGGVIAVLLIEALSVKVFLLCRELKDFFYFSLLNIQLILQEQIHNDAGSSITYARIFHNKVTVTLVEFFRHYLYFWDIRFLTAFLTPLGVFLVFAGFWYILKGKMPTLHKTVLLLIILAFPLFEMIAKPNLPFVLRVILLCAPYLFLSAIGTWHFLSQKSMKHLFIFVLLAILSIWWILIFQNEIFNFCVKL